MHPSFALPPWRPPAAPYTRAPSPVRLRLMPQWPPPRIRFRSDKICGCHGPFTNEVRFVYYSRSKHTSYKNMLTFASLLCSRTRLGLCTISEVNIPRIKTCSLLHPFCVTNEVRLTHVYYTRPTSRVDEKERGFAVWCFYSNAPRDAIVR